MISPLITIFFSSSKWTFHSWLRHLAANLLRPKVSLHLSRYDRPEKSPNHSRFFSQPVQCQSWCSARFLAKRTRFPLAGSTCQTGLYTTLWTDRGGIKLAKPPIMLWYLKNGHVIQKPFGERKGRQLKTIFFLKCPLSQSHKKLVWLFRSCAGNENFELLMRLKMSEGLASGEEEKI